ncbi:MAG: hypothetical protein PHH10_00350, partial [Dysgonamonadaceae bacterium]|nr:hypothetical protein [Dysgonamonadaceae bacterium]
WIVGTGLTPSRLMPFAGYEIRRNARDVLEMLADITFASPKFFKRVILKKLNSCLVSLTKKRNHKKTIIK